MTTSFSVKSEDIPLTQLSQQQQQQSSSNATPVSSGSNTGSPKKPNNGNADAAKNETPEGTPLEAEPSSELKPDVAYDEDGLPIPTGIEEINEKDLEESGESLNLDLSHAGSQVWLVKLPPRLADVWKDESILDGRQLGQVKIERGSNPARIFLNLNDELEEHKRLDKEYQLKLIKPVVENQYVFSETELDHFKHRLMYRTQVMEMPFQPKLRNLNKDAQNHAVKYTKKIKSFKRDLPESGMGTTRPPPKGTGGFGGRNSRNNKFRKFIPYAKTIPKKTDLVGKIAHEGQVIPVKLAIDNKLKFLEQKKRFAQMSKRRTINYMKHESAGILQSRAGPNINTGATISLSKELANAKKEAIINKAEGRAARMERDKLMKLLFNLFNEFEYWGLKGIKERTNQPEAYLKECLETIAVMERKGTYALKYRLKDEFKQSRDAERKENGIVDDEDDKNMEEDEDEGESDVEMEDVN